MEAILKKKHDGCTWLTGLQGMSSNELESVLEQVSNRDDVTEMVYVEWHSESMPKYSLPDFTEQIWRGIQERRITQEKK